MNRKIAYLILAFISFSCLSAQQYASFLIPDSLTKNADAVIRNEQINITIYSPEKMVVHLKKVVTVFNEDGRSEAFFDAFYDKYKNLGNINITAYDKLGRRIKKVKLKDIKDVKYYTGNFIDDVRLKKYHSSVNNFPYTVEYEYTVTYDGFVSIPGWYPYYYNKVGVEKTSYTIHYPSNYKFNIESRNIPDSILTEATTANRSKNWELSNLTPKYYEPYSPVSDHYLPRLKLTPLNFYYDGYPGKLTDWENFGLWEKNLIDLSNAMPEELKGKLDALTEGLTTDLEKVKVIYDYLQNNTRYISIQLGIGGWKPLDVEEVYEKGYGDCKALSNFMVSMLNAQGIKAYNVVIRNSQQNIPISTEYPSFNFNHMIACVPLSTDTLWLECTSQKVPFGYIGSGNSDKHVMLVTDEGGKLVKTPSNNARENNIFIKSYCELSENGDITISSKGIFQKNLMEDRFRQVFASKKDQQIQLYNQVKVPNVAIDSFNYVLDKDNYQITETIHMHAGKYASQAGDYLFLPITPDPDKFNANLKPNGERLAPIENTSAYHNIDTIITKLPEGYACKTAEFDTMLTTPFGVYNAHFYAEGDHIVFVRELLKWHKIYTPDLADDFIAFFETIGEIETKQIVIYKLN